MSRPLALLLLTATLLAVSPAARPADDSPVNDTTVKMVLGLTKLSFVKRHIEPGRLVAWDTQDEAYYTDEFGNNAYSAVIFAGVIRQGDDAGRRYVTTLNIFVDPETKEVDYTLSDFDGGEGWASDVATADELAKMFPDEDYWMVGIKRDDQDGGTEQEPGPADKWSAHSQDLRRCESELRAALAEIKSWSPVPEDPEAAEKWARDLKEAGDKAVLALDGYSMVLFEFVEPMTRAGWNSDIMIAQANVDRTYEIVEKYAEVLDVQIVKGPAAARTVSEELDRDLQLYLAKKIGEHFESEGVTVVASSESAEQARTVAVERVKAKLKQRADQAIQSKLGVPFHNVPTAVAAARHQMRQVARQRITELLFNVTSKPFVVKFVGEIIVSLIEGGLTEAFRGTGRLPERVEVSTGTLRTARIRLYSLPPDAYLDDVRAEIRRAEGTAKATLYLQNDLRRAKSPLLDEYEVELAYLGVACESTKRRFLLKDTGSMEDLKSEVALVSALAGLLRQIIEGIRAPETIAEEGEDDDYDEVAQDPPGDDEEDEPERKRVPVVKYDPGIHMYHICKWFGPNGPVDKDYWYATEAPPDPKGGKGIGVVNQQGTIDISEYDSHKGPFGDNHALLKAIAATKQNSAYFRGDWLRGNPKP